MNKEDYFKYYIQGSDHYLIPKDVFDELFNEMSNWKEEAYDVTHKIKYNERSRRRMQKSLMEKIDLLEQQCKKQKEVINEVNKKLNNFIGCCKAEKLESGSDYIHHQYWDMFERFNKQIKDILKEVSK